MTRNIQHAHAGSHERNHHPYSHQDSHPCVTLPSLQRDNVCQGYRTNYEPIARVLISIFVIIAPEGPAPEGGLVDVAYDLIAFDRWVH